MEINTVQAILFIAIQIAVGVAYIVSIRVTVQFLEHRIDKYDERYNDYYDEQRQNVVRFSELEKSVAVMKEHIDQLKKDVGNFNASINQLKDIITGIVVQSDKFRER